MALLIISQLPLGKLTGPGETAFTRMRFGPHAWLSCLLYVSRAALMALKACGTRKVSMAAVLDMMITEPAPERARYGSRVSQPLTVPSRSKSKHFCQSPVACEP